MGSIGFMATSAVTLANSFDSGELLGNDDSTLTLRDYRATWVLMVVSGACCIFGMFRLSVTMSINLLFTILKSPGLFCIYHIMYYVCA